jgi:hypothetical protein
MYDPEDYGKEDYGPGGYGPEGYYPEDCVDLDEYFQVEDIQPHGLEDPLGPPYMGDEY